MQGLWGKPTVLNNVETYANVPAIICSHGGPWFAAHGTEKSKGTKVFALAGAIKNSGLVEVPVGMPLGDLIYDIGGGIPAGKEFKAAQIGGPSGGCIPKQHLNVPLDYESLSELGAIMGSGGLIVMDEDSCMVDVARYFLEFVQEESCGKCVPCRVGTKRMLEILNRICEGRGEEADVERLIDLGEMIKDTSLCGLGQTASNPVLSTIRHFGQEYVEHIRDKHCRAGVCAALGQCPLLQRLPGQRRYSRLRFAGGREALCRSAAAAPRAQSVRGRLLAGLFPHLRGQVPPFDVGRAGFDPRHQALHGRPRGDHPTARGPRERSRTPSGRSPIVGAGPAGLSCAYFLARLGYRPQVFEAEPRPGGMLVQAIPAYRLPREIVAREVRMIEHMGVEIFTEHVLGEDFTLKSLRAEGYDAVFLGVGAPSGVELGMPGEDAEGITDALSFLRTYNQRGSVPVGKKVVVIGGGNSAIDAARTALRLGAEQVTVVYRRSREAMPAYEEEIEEAEHEGVKLRLLTAPVEVVLEGRRVAGIKCLPMRLGEFDRSGRRRPEEGGDAFVIPGRPGAGGHRPDARLAEDLQQRAAGSPQPDVHPGQPGDRPDLGEVDFRRRRRRDRPLVGGRGGGGRRAGGRGHRPLPDRQEPRLLARRPRGRYGLRSRRRALRRPPREAEPDPRRAAAQQLRRSRAAVARVGGRPPGRPLPALRLWQTLRGQPSPTRSAVR